MVPAAKRPACRGLGLAALITLVGVTLAAGASADDAFFKGKRVTLLVNFAVGGPTDIEGRLFAKYIVRHIEGQPSMIVQNMDGAGGIVGAKYLGEVAPRDGTMIGYITGTGFMYALDPDRFRVDFKTYEFLAYQPGTTIHYMRVDVPPGMKQATDIAKAEGLIAGGLSVDTPKDLRLRLALDMLGVPYKYVTGYRSSPPARLALERGEINMFSESPPSYRSVIEPGIVAKGVAMPVFYDPGYDGQAFSVPKQVEGLAILPFHELFQKIHGKMPSGKLWDVYRTILSADGAMQRQIVLPPAAPPAAVAALRAAIAGLNADQDYAQEASQSFGFVPQWETGPGTDDKVRRALSTDPAIRAFLVDYMKNPSK